MFLKIITADCPEGPLDSVIQRPGNEALELISRRKAVWVPEEDFVAYNLKKEAQAKGDIVTVTAVVNGEKMTEGETQTGKQSGEGSGETGTGANGQAGEGKAQANEQSGETQQENPYKELPNKDAVKAELDKRGISYEKNATRPVLEELLLKDDKEKAATGNEAGEAE